MARKKGGKGTIVAVVVAGCGCLVTLLGIAAAVAIPSFVSYTRRSKAAEARVHVEAICYGLDAYLVQTGHLPAALPRTPASPGCGERVPWPSNAAPGWAEIGFTPLDPVYYAYEYEPGPDGSSLVIRAVGDLDCDGVTSLYELRVPDTHHGVDCLGPIYIENEVE